MSLGISTCFSKIENRYDTVIGLLINKVEFGVNIRANYKFNPLPFLSPHLG